MAESQQNHYGITLTLRTADGYPWLLTMSAGTEIFIGRYRRLKDFDCGTGLIGYSRINMSNSPTAPAKSL
jgi:hypothetical protein